MKRAIVHIIFVAVALFAADASGTEDRGKDISAETRDDIEWKSYPTAQPGWHVSVAYVRAFVDEMNGLPYLTAPCGDSGEIVYVGGFVSDSPVARVAISKLNMRTGKSAAYVFTLSQMEEYVEGSSLEGLACSPDGARVAVFFESLSAQKTFILDLKTLAATSLGETRSRDRLQTNGRLIDPSFSLLLGRPDHAAGAKQFGIEIVPLERLLAEESKVLGGQEPLATAFVEKDSVASVVSNFPRPGGFVVRLKGKELTDVQTCSIKRDMIVNVAQRAPGGLVITVSRAADLKRSRRYFVDLGKLDGGACNLQPVGAWDALLIEGRQIDAYLGDSAVAIRARNAMATPPEDAKTFKVNFTLLIDGSALPLFSPELRFSGLDEWNEVSEPSHDQFTFLYGPHMEGWDSKGPGTVLVHFWKSKAN